MSCNPSKVKHNTPYEPVFRIPIHIVRHLCQDRDFVDCGVNVGQHVGYFLPHCKRYIAIDCDTRCIVSLARKYKNNDNIVIVQACLSDRPRLTHLHLHNSKPSINFIQQSSPHVKVVNYHRVHVYTSTLGSILQQLNASPGIIKIDIEGAEYIALLGAVGYLSSCHPLLLVEIHPRTQLSDLHEVLGSMGYEVVRKGRSTLSNNLHLVFAHRTIIDLFQGQ